MRVLDELLWNCCCREERATLLPEAFMPPGLEVRVLAVAIGVMTAYYGSLELRMQRSRLNRLCIKLVSTWPQQHCFTQPRAPKP